MSTTKTLMLHTVIKLANEGSMEAQQMLQQENGLRVESGQPTVQEALTEIVEEYELRQRIEAIKAKKRRQKK